LNPKTELRFYYSEGALFEIATDWPGMTVDERPVELGKKLTLPERYEPLRSKLAHVLTPLNLPINLTEHQKE
jgi:glyoxalase family protein